MLDTMQKEYKMGDYTFTIINRFTGRVWQQIQKVSVLIRAEKIDHVDYGNKLIRLLVVKMVDNTGAEPKEVKNMDDIFKTLLETGGEIIDELADTCIEIVANDKYVKKKNEKVAKSTTKS